MAIEINPTFRGQEIPTHFNLFASEGDEIPDGTLIGYAVFKDVKSYLVWLEGQIVSMGSKPYNRLRHERS